MLVCSITTILYPASIGLLLVPTDEPAIAILPVWLPILWFSWTAWWTDKWENFKVSICFCKLSIRSLDLSTSLCNSWVLRSLQSRSTDNKCFSLLSYWSIDSSSLNLLFSAWHYVSLAWSLTFSSLIITAWLARSCSSRLSVLCNSVRFCSYPMVTDWKV